jgi:putative flippase GtrA
MSRSFFRAQMSSLAATVTDFGLLAVLTEWVGLWYVLSTALGAASGALVNFLINRYWSFERARLGSGAGNRGALKQALRYGVVALGSWALNVGGVWWATEEWGTHYLLSKVLVSLTVGIAFNYPLHRWFVFSPEV